MPSLSWKTNILDQLIFMVVCVVTDVAIAITYVRVCTQHLESVFDWL